MYLTASKKKEIFTKFGRSADDTGSSEGQIALFTHRIKHLTEHLRNHKKDLNTQKALLNMVGRRRRLLNYVKDCDINRYREVIKELGIRK